MAAPDLRQLPRNDLGVLGAGVLAFIVSFFPYYGWSFNSSIPGLDSGDFTVNAWHGTALVGMLLVVAAAVVAAAIAFVPEQLPKMAISWNFVVLALSLLGALLVVIRSFTLPSVGGGGADLGIRWGGWLLIIVCVAQAAFAALRFRDTHEKMPWQHPTSPPATPMPQ